MKRGCVSKDFKWQDTDKECSLEFKYSLGIRAIIYLTRQEDGSWNMQELRFDLCAPGDYTEIYRGNMKDLAAAKRKAEQWAGTIIDTYDRVINGHDALETVEEFLREKEKKFP